MPQMSPMWWSTLFLIFTTSYILYMIMTYFFMNYKMNSNINTKKINNQMNWKW